MLSSILKTIERAFSELTGQLLQRTTLLAWGLLSLPGLLSSGCQDSAGQKESKTVEAAAPALKADGQDLADHDCRIVLRRAERALGGQPYLTEEHDGVYWWVWEAIVDLDQDLANQGAQVGILFAPYGGPTWYLSTRTEEIPSMHPGFRRYRILLSENTVSPSQISTTGLSRFWMELVPVALLPDGTRLFDHNRNPGDFDNYRLEASSDNMHPSFVVSPDEGICSQVHAVLDFQAGFRNLQHGALVRGGQVTIHYAPQRLDRCIGKADRDTWHAELSVRHLPSGRVDQIPLEPETVSSNQHPITFRSMDVTIPMDADSMEIWAHAWNDDGCEQWDSNYGQNFVFPVLASAPAPVGWAGDWGGSFYRDCAWSKGLAESIDIDEFIIEQACMEITADVYVPGLTDQPTPHYERILARVAYRVDDGPEQYQFLDYDGPVLHNVRFQWTLPRQEMMMNPWNTYRYAFEFSTDGVTWYRIGQGDGPDGGEDRILRRTFQRSEWDQ